MKIIHITNAFNAKNKELIMLVNYEDSALLDELREDEMEVTIYEFEGSLDTSIPTDRPLEYTGLW